MVENTQHVVARADSSVRRCASNFSGIELEAINRISREDAEYIKKYLTFYKKLLNGQIPADNQKRINFLRVAMTGFNPETPHEKAYKNFIFQHSVVEREIEFKKSGHGIELWPEGARDGGRNSEVRGGIGMVFGDTWDAF
jgi:hypothetical protein